MSIENQEDTFTNSIEVKKKNKLSSKVIIGSFVLVVIAGIILGFMYVRYTKTEEYRTKKNNKEIASLIEKVNKIYILPVGNPAIFSVTNPETLVSQMPFFTGSVKGDKLLYYSELGTAIIYSPSRNKVVNVGPVVFGNKNISDIDTTQLPTISDKNKTTIKK